MYTARGDDDDTTAAVTFRSVNIASDARHNHLVPRIIAIPAFRPRGLTSVCHTDNDAPGPSLATQVSSR